MVERRYRLGGLSKIHEFAALIFSLPFCSETRVGAAFSSFVSNISFICSVYSGESLVHSEFNPNFLKQHVNAFTRSKHDEISASID